FLDDFELKKDDMERSFELSLKAYGACKVNKNGNWILETDDKEVDLTKLDDRKYMYINNPPEYGGQVKQTTIIEFPKEAKNIQIAEDAYGQTIFKFDMENRASAWNGWQWLGVSFTLIGAVWLGRNVRRQGTET